MKSFVFTAGLGTRFRPITSHIPKPAIPLLNIPMVYYALTPLFKADVKDLVCNLHHLPDKMSKTLNTLKDKASIQLIKEHPNLLGSAGGIQNARAYLQDEEHFFVVNGDTVFLPEDPQFLNQVLRQHRQYNALATLVLTPYSKLDQYSAVWFHRRTNKVIGFGYQKPEDDLSILGGHFTGYYLFANRIFKYLKFVNPETFNPETHIFKDILSKAINEGEDVFCFHQKGHWFEVGNKIDFLKTTKALLNLREKCFYLQDIMLEYSGPQTDDVYFSKDIRISKTALLGESVNIGEGVVVSGFSVIGNYANLKSHTHINNSVILPYCKVAEDTSINESIIYK